MILIPSFCKGFSKYFASHVHIGENNGQDLSIKSSFLWDAERDRHVDFSLKIDNKESGDTRTGMFLVAKVFFLYYD